MSTDRPVDLPAAMQRGASISPDGRYRWWLLRDWRSGREQPRWVTFVMLNPSTADAARDDPTIRRCLGFARAFGATGLVVVNLYALRATEPAALWRAEDPVGPQNDATLAECLELARRGGFPVVAGWGAQARADRVERVLAMTGAGRLTCLGVTKDGAPNHPLYRPADTALQPWPARRGAGFGPDRSAGVRGWPPARAVQPPHGAGPAGAAAAR